MKVSEAFPGNFLKAADLQGRAVKVTIGGIKMEEVGDGKKPVMYFHGKKRGLVCNKTNAGICEGLFDTDEMDDWMDRQIELYPDRTQFQGKTVDCIRVRGVLPPAAETAADDGESF